MNTLLMPYIRNKSKNYDSPIKDFALPRPSDAAQLSVFWQHSAKVPYRTQVQLPAHNDLSISSAISRIHFFSLTFKKEEGIMPY